MDFKFTQEQEILRKTIREFSEKKIKPLREKWDEEQKFHWEIIEDLKQMGLFGILFPEKYGGSGLGYIEYVIILEELAKVDPSVSLTIAAHNSLCSNHIYTFGTDKQKEKYLKKLASGEVLGAWALTEPGSGSDAQGMLTTAKRVEGGWILNGSKAFITHATVGEIAVVLAITNPEDKKNKISAFIVELNSKGVIRGKKENKMGMRASDTGPLVFEDCFIPEENLIPPEGKGFKQAMEVLDGGRISIAALSLGLAEGAFGEALEYAKTRKQFGEPLINFEGIQFYFAEMATKIEAVKLLTYKAASLKDEGKEVIMESSMAKYFAGETAVYISERAVQILGGYGFIKDYPVEKYYRDVKLCTIGEGTSEIQQLIIARQLMRQ
ncbi:MAG: acyl-CoA dehydrogenase family protein [Thermoanaerobaculia bacterium]